MFLLGIMRNKKKIIRACTVSNSIRFFKEVIVKMKSDGYETVVVTSPGVLLDDFRKECPDFKTIEVPMERHISLFKDIVALMRMIKVFISERPYIVHSMTPKAGLICMLAGWFTRVPVRIHTFTGLVWPTAVGMKRKVLMTTDRILCACATHVIPEGQGVLNDLKNHNVCKKPMKVLGYGNVMGVDMERFDPKRFEKEICNRDGFVFLFVGRIVGDKGINELVEAFSKLHEKYPNTELRLVGRYEMDLDPVSEKTQNTIKTYDGIITVGSKFGDDLLWEYANADCFVMPSYREGFPNTVLEAGAMGLPQIVTDINGSREIVNDGENGLVIPVKESKAIFESMERILQDENLREYIKKNARPMIASRFEKNFVQECQINFYKELNK